jgi:hypothetical protein
MLMGHHNFKAPPAVFFSIRDSRFFTSGGGAFGRGAVAIASA